MSAYFALFLAALIADDPPKLTTKAIASAIPENTSKAIYPIAEPQEAPSAEQAPIPQLSIPILLQSL